MDFSLSSEHKMIRQTARDFARQILKPGVIDRDSRGDYPKTQVKAMAEMNFLGIIVEEKYGGGMHIWKINK